ncbi:MAG: amidohydrolase family protein [Candidatus Thermoplasmatota archaeon]|nr:amidohydrolase family protein [Candidatus Thermoplasmatota archaeon]
MHDILIRNGKVIDGTGSPGVMMDLVIDGTKIGRLYKPGDGKGSMEIDAEGLVVCPGFVDIHTHSDFSLLGCPLAESKIRQGVTTELLGNCGGSAAPIIGAARKQAMDYAKKLWVDVTWSSFDEYLLHLSDVRTSVNVASLVGADTLRLGVIGANDTLATENQLRQMNELLAQAMIEGAYGLSSGLIYAPGCFASTDELTSLASTSASLGGFYASHIRGEGRTVVKAVAEAIKIGRDADSRVQISHHKATGIDNWGLVSKTITMIEAARSEGVDVVFDVYPYTASSTWLNSILPPGIRDGETDSILKRLGDEKTREEIKRAFQNKDTDWENTVAEDGWDRIVLIGLKSEKYGMFENKSISDAASALNVSPDDLALDILAEDYKGAIAIFHEISEDDVKTVISHPLSAIGSDGEAEAPYGPTGDSATHPRSYGTFPRVIRRYSIEMGLFPVEEAIRKMTSWPAERIGLDDRGTIAKGMAADVVVFDPDKIRDMATFEDSHRYPEGIVHVLVNGQITIQDGEHTKERAGQVFRHKPRVS